MISDSAFFITFRIMHTDELFDAIRSQNATRVKELLEKDPSLAAAKDQRGSTALLLATYYGFEDVAAEVLKFDQNIDAQDASGNTALMGVSFKGYPGIAKLLIESGADVNAQNFNGATALIFAATFNQEEIVKLLIDNNADTDLTDSRGQKAADHARMQGLNHLVELIEG